MPWLNVDDGFADHPKVLEVIALDRAALVCWLMCGVWSAKHLRNGTIPKHVALRNGSQLELDALVSAGLFIEHEKAYEISGYLEANRSKEQVERDREAGRKRVAEWRAKQGNAASNGVTNGVVTGLDGKKKKGARPDWCGECDQRSRFVEVQGSDQVTRCPRCHPELAA